MIMWVQVPLRVQINTKIMIGYGIIVIVFLIALCINCGIVVTVKKNKDDEDPK